MEKSMTAESLMAAEGETDSIIAALMTTVESTGIDVSGADVVFAAARRRLLASTFKFTITFRGSAGDVATLTAFFASATNMAALLAALKAEGIDVISIMAASDESWIGIPIGCSLVRGTQAKRRRLRQSTCEPPALARKRAPIRPLLLLQQHKSLPTFPLSRTSKCTTQGVLFLLCLFVGFRTYARKSKGACVGVG